MAIRGTDQLCIELAKPGRLVSPTAFQNSVDNTAAGYWTIVHGCREPATALAPGDVPEALAHLGQPCPIGASGNRAEFSDLLETAPAAWALPLLQSAALGETGPVALSGNGWVGDLLLATSAAA